MTNKIRKLFLDWLFYVLLVTPRNQPGTWMIWMILWNAAKTWHDLLQYHWSIKHGSTCWSSDVIMLSKSGRVVVQLWQLERLANDNYIYIYKMRFCRVRQTDAILTDTKKCIQNHLRETFGTSIYPNISKHPEGTSKFASSKFRLKSEHGKIWMDFWKCKNPDFPTTWSGFGGWTHHRWRIYQSITGKIIGQWVFENNNNNTCILYIFHFTNHWK